MRQAIRAILSTIAVIGAVVLFATVTPMGRGAFASPTTDAMSIASQVATAAASYTPSFKITCATTPTAITHASGMYEVACFTRASASVYLGTSTVSAADNLFCLSTTDAQCAGKGLVWEVTQGITHCTVASGTEELLCMRTK